MRGYLLLVFVTLIWGTTFPVQKMVIGDVSPLFYNAVRFSIAAAVSYLLWGKGDWKRGGLLGVILALSYASQTAGLKLTTSSKNGFFTSIYVVLVPFVSWMIEGIRPKSNHVAGAVAALIGSYLLAGGVRGFNFGDFLSLLCGVGFAFHVVLITELSRRTKEEDLLFPQFLLTALMNLLLSSGRWDMNVPALGVAAYTALAATVFGIWVQVKFQKVMGSNTAALIFAGEPVFAMIFSLLMLKETFTPSQLVGAGLLVSSMILAGVRR